MKKEDKEIVHILYEFSDSTLEQIANKVGVGTNAVWKLVRKHYTPEYRKERKIKNYAKSKTGNKNPMFGQTGADHPSYIGIISDGKGYQLIVKPSWYTARKGTKHIFYHHYVMCLHLGITEIPKGWCVHHKDENKINNDISNLEYMTISDHMKLHQAMRSEGVSLPC